MVIKPTTVIIILFTMTVVLFLVPFFYMLHSYRISPVNYIINTTAASVLNNDLNSRQEKKEPHCRIAIIQRIWQV